MVALGGVAYSSIPDASGVIHGCYTTQGSRTLRVIDSAESCLGSETALNWSQQGPAGPTGPAGAQGPQGAQGPPGQPPAFTKSVAKVTVAADVGFAEVARLNVPAGRYVVIAKALALASGSQSFGLTIGGCWLRVGAAGLDGKLVVEQASDFSSASLVTGGGVSFSGATLTTMVANEFAPRGTLAKPGAISLRCSPGVVPSPAVDFRHIRIAAIRVAELPDLTFVRAAVPKATKRKVQAVRKKGERARRARAARSAPARARPGASGTARPPRR
jgi:hypothetical protein